MKKGISLFMIVILICSFSACTSSGDTFSQTGDGNLVSASGEEYGHLANEGVLYYLGDLEWLGSVEGEGKISQHLGLPYQTGVFSIKGDEDRNILIRYSANSEWFSIYRKRSLPTFDYSVDNCARLELVLGIGNSAEDAVHTSCGDGIDSTQEIAEFLSEVRAQKSPREAGLYDRITKPDGMLENCYVYAVIYGFFEEEPNLVLRMEVTSYNDLAYSVKIGEKAYVLPEEWLQRLQHNK